VDWIGLSSVLRPHQHSIGYLGDGFYRSKDPTNSITVLKEHIVHSREGITTSTYLLTSGVLCTRSETVKLFA